MTQAYFTTRDGVWFQPSPFARGPWNVGACHAGPPAGLMARALERAVPHQRLAGMQIELLRPIPMKGFRVQAEVRRPGRSVTLTEAEIFDDDRVYARAFATHLRQLDELSVQSAPFALPSFAEAVAGPFPLRDTVHGERSFVDSVEVRYDPGESQGTGGPTTVWMRTKVPLLADEQPSGVQAICPLADSGNGISFNEYLDRVRFVNPDLHLSLHREPDGEWFCSVSRSHWQPDGTGTADSELFDHRGPVGRSVQNLLLDPAP